MNGRAKSEVEEQKSYWKPFQSREVRLGDKGTTGRNLFYIDVKQSMAVLS